MQKAYFIFTDTTEQLILLKVKVTQSTAIKFCKVNKLRLIKWPAGNIERSYYHDKK
jgi:hypothetical protein